MGAEDTQLWMSVLSPAGVKIPAQELPTSGKAKDEARPRGQDRTQKKGKIILKDNFYDKVSFEIKVKHD